MVIYNNRFTTLLCDPICTYRIILPETYDKVLYWLHGFQERSADIIFKSNFEELAETYQMAVVIPDLPDTYYLDQPWNNCYTEEFFFEEFMPYIQKNYQLPSEPSSCFIGGVSMGGFGSLLYAGHHPELFSKTISISGAFIINDLLIGNPEVTGIFDGNLAYFQNIFGDIPSLENDVLRNPKTAALTALNPDFPEIILACGKRDMLYSRNVRLYDCLMNSGANVRWIKNNDEQAGEHNWLYFRHALNEICDKHFAKNSLS